MKNTFLLLSSLVLGVCSLHVSATDKFCGPPEVRRLKDDSVERDKDMKDENRRVVEHYERALRMEGGKKAIPAGECRDEPPLFDDNDDFSLSDWGERIPCVGKDGIPPAVEMQGTEFGQWAPVGVLELYNAMTGDAEQNVCTAWLAGPTTAITAAHCVYTANVDWSLAGNMWLRLVLGRNGDGTAGTEITLDITRMTVFTDWATQNNELGPDIAVLDLGATFFPHLSWVIPEGDEAGVHAMVGYPGNALSRKVIEYSLEGINAAIALYDYVPDHYFFHKHSSYPGFSGAPVISVKDMHVLGVNRGWVGVNNNDCVFYAHWLDSPGHTYHINYMLDNKRVVRTGAAYSISE